MAESGWNNFIVVGFGLHARTKLIPAILANGQKVAALVSGQDPASLPLTPVYRTLGKALEAVDAGTAVILASPPAAHYEQALLAVSAGFDIIVEKPAFTTVDDVRRVAKVADRTGAVIVEAFMHRHTALYGRAVDYWNRRRNTIRAIRLDFVVPELPAGTFRAVTDAASSVLYDIGCYPLSLLCDFGLHIEELSLASVACANTMRERLTIVGNVDDIEIQINCGVGAQYANALVFDSDGGATTYAPFFYGRPGERTISSDEEVEQLHEHDAFATMLATSRDVWFASQPARLGGLTRVTAALERLGRDLTAVRGGGVRSCNMSAID